ncbi:MAG TPA: beta-ketoacyl synthase N-terminal-like domain-containing protein [Chthoniobacteraceae bacterium]|nr:beta-ketoacyl synthase N-terminal-like domain-containing protein [Chthoniobacteraceae bacterium]
MPQAVYVLGTARTDFRRNLRKEGRALGDIIVESGRAAIDDARIAPADIGAGVVGNFAAGLFTRQLHLGAFLTAIDDALRGLPAMHVEGACASGALAVLTAAQQIMGGLHEAVLVVGAEQQKTMPPAEGADVLGAASDFAREKAPLGDFMFPKLFGRIARTYIERYGVSEEVLARVAVKNYAHARLNPLAQMRDDDLTFDKARTASDSNPSVAPPLKISDCSQISDGAAALVLCSESFWKKLGRPAGVRLAGYGHTTDRLALDDKDAPDFAIARKAADQAFAMARLTPADLDGAEVHDCFSISEIIAYELLGLAPRGQGASLIESGATALPAVRDRLEIQNSKFKIQNFPVNTGGGLIGDGHPVGATGVRQVADAHAQLTDRAGARQIEGARRILTFNIGGTFTSNVVMIWERT